MESGFNALARAGFDNKSLYLYRNMGVDQLFYIVTMDDWNGWHVFIHLQTYLGYVARTFHVNFRGIFSWVFDDQMLLRGLS